MVIEQQQKQTNIHVLLYLNDHILTYVTVNTGTVYKG